MTTPDESAPIRHIPAHLIYAACNDRKDFDAGALAELARSIEAIGLLELAS